MSKTLETDESQLATVEEAPVGTSPFSGLFGGLGNLDLNDEEKTGKFFGGLFKRVNDTIINPPAGSNTEESVADRLYEAFGISEDIRNQVRLKTQVEAFFMEQLQTIGMVDAIILTKERFSLPDDYSIEIKTRVFFKIPETRKTEEPDVD